MPTWRRIPICYQISKRHLKIWLVLAISHAWTKSGFWQIKMDEPSKQYTAFTVGNLGFFKCDCMPFGMCNVPATFQRLMQNCLRELNLTYCLIYLNDIIVFLWTVEEHLHPLCIVCEQFREHTLKLKPSKCNFLRDEITYLAHQVLKDCVHPSNMNIKAIAECAPPQTYMEVCAFLSLVGHYQRFIKGFTHISHPLSKYLNGEGASMKSEWVSLTKEAIMAFEALKWACMTVPILVFADYSKPFLWETDASKDGLGAVLSQKQADGWYHHHCLWQQSPNTSWKALSLNQTWVFSIKMGSYGTL